MPPFVTDRGLVLSESNGMAEAFDASLDASHHNLIAIIRLGEEDVKRGGRLGYRVLSKNSRFRLELTRIRRYTQEYASP